MVDRERITKLYEGLHNICLAANTKLEIDAMMRKVAAASAEAVGCESSLIALLEKDHWIIKCVYRLPQESVGALFSHGDVSIAMLVEQALKSVHISNTGEDPRIFAGLVKQLGVRSLLAVPLIIQSEVLGILLLNYHSRPVAFTGDEMSFADKCGAILSMALRNALLLERTTLSEMKTRRANAFSDALNSINTIIHSSLDYEEIMQSVVRETALAVDAGSAMIYIRENGGWQARYVYGLPEEIIGRKLTEEEVGYSALAAGQKRSIVINDAQRDSRVRRDIVSQYGIRAILDVALTVGDDLIGDFALHYHVPEKVFDELKVDFVNKVASSLTLALKNARLYGQRQAILEMLRESEERFRSAFACAAFGMLLTGIDGLILQVNRALCRMLGYPEPELLRKTFLELTHPDDLEASRDLVNDLAQGRRDYGVLEKRFRHRDGRVIWVLLSVAAIRDSRGKSLYFVLQVQDITDRKLAEEALRRAARTGSRLQEVMVAISSSRTFEEALQLLLDAALDLTGMEGGGIYLVEKGQAVLRYHRGLPEAFIRDVEREPLDRPMVQAVLNQKELLDLVEKFDGVQVLFTNHGMCHAFSIPLRVHEETFGFLNVGSTRAERPPQVDIQTLTILATETESLLHRLLIEQALRESEERFRGAFAHAAFGMALVSPEGRILQVNPSLCRLSGYSEQDLLGRDSQDFTHPDDREASYALLADLIKGNREYGWLEKRYIHKDGHVLWAVLSIAVIRDDRGKPLYFVSQMQDITDRKLAEEALRESRAKLSTILQNTPAAIYLLDADGRFNHVNPRFEELFGIPGDRAVGRSVHDLFPPDVADSFAVHNRQVMEGRTSLEFEEMIPRPDGIHTYASVKSPLIDAAGRSYAVVGISTDITERKKMMDEIRHLANHDALTGLPNRRFFLDIIEFEVAQARRNKKKLAILFLDLDRFKEVNDILGHEAGDELLKKVAARLKATIRASDTIVRMGGDEFNFILSDIAHPVDSTVTIRKIMESFRRPFLVAGQELHMTASIGVSIYPDDSKEIGTLFRYADIALYESKNLGKNAFYFYNAAINLRSIERIRLESSLRQSLERGELEVFYQPQIDIKSRRIVSAEALVRWHHPQKGLLDPRGFIPSAEDSGFITTIDEYVLKAACTRLRSWLDAGLSPVRVAVNVSAREFQNPEMFNRIASMLRETGVPPSYLEVEITETLAMSNIERTISRLTELAELGIHASIDDFGTGYSSLNYLKRLPIQKLKIDQSFVKDIATNADDRAIISAVTAMAHSMDIKVLAEGVETAEQLAFLDATRCDEVQGFLFSRPLPAQTFSEIMEAGK
jgi:diguanylate cyclase (GGDEF)-like protein/PAS domain S-box-containing protein